MPATPLTAALPGRRAFITGGASGLGLALATRLACDRWTLGLLDRDGTRLAAAAHALGLAGAAAVHVFVADVTDEVACTRAVADFATGAGGLDLMVNNAGVAVAGRVEETPVADWRFALEVNVIGVAIGCRAALPVMRRAGSGLILNIASAAAFACAGEMGAYNASKAAVVALTETLVQELDGTGVRAAVAMPGFFPTNLLATMRAPARTVAFARELMARSDYTAERAAADMLAACARGDVYIVLPAPYVTLWRLKRWLPRYFARLLARKRGGRSTART
jgi:short-subunit dehydrogenase